MCLLTGSAALGNLKIISAPNIPSLVGLSLLLLPHPYLLPNISSLHLCKETLPLCGTNGLCVLFKTYHSMYVCVCVCVSRSVMSDSAIPWTVAHQAPLPMGFSRQEYWSGLPFPSPSQHDGVNSITHYPSNFHVRMNNPGILLKYRF